MIFKEGTEALIHVFPAHFFILSQVFTLYHNGNCLLECTVTSWLLNVLLCFQVPFSAKQAEATAWPVLQSPPQNVQCPSSKRQHAQYPFRSHFHDTV